MANMKYQKQRIDGSDVIIPEPQHLDGTEYVNTGTSNPLPTKDESVEARLQAIEQTQSQILDKLNDTIDTRLTGSNVEDENSIPTNKITKQEIEVLLDSMVIPAGEDSGVRYLTPKGASEIYLFIQIDKQPWSLRYRNQFGSVSEENGYPVLRRVEETFRRSAPAISFPVGYNPEQGVESPSNLKEAKDWGLPITSSEYYRLQNYSDEDATVTVSMLRVWR